MPQYAMANGQVVLVTTEGLSGGPPMRTVYYVAEEDPTKAQAIIAKIMASNEKVEAFGLLPEAAVKALGFRTISGHVGPEAFYRAINKIDRSLIRVDAETRSIFTLCCAST